MSNTSPDPLLSYQGVTRSGHRFAANKQASTGSTRNAKQTVESGATHTHSSRNESQSRSSYDSLFHSPPPEKGKRKKGPTAPNAKKPRQLPSPPATKKRTGASFTVISQTPQTTAPSNHSHTWRVAIPPPFPLPVPPSKESMRNTRKSGPGLGDSAHTGSSGRGQQLITAPERPQQISLSQPGALIETLPKRKFKPQYPTSTVSNSSSSSQTAIDSTSSEHLVKRKHLSSLPGSSNTSPLLSDMHIPTKRQKAIVEGTPHHPMMKHPTLWLPDGNTIIQLGQTQFNLHRSRLVKASPIFSDLFKQSSIGGTEQSGILILRRGDGIVCILDSMKIPLEDVEIMFEIFEEGLGYSHEDPPFTTIASVLRAATILNFPALREWADKHFQGIWKPLIKKGPGIDTEDTLMFVTLVMNPHAVESLDLAREIQDTTITKLALYDLCRSGVLPDCVSQNDCLTIARTRQELRRAWARLAASPSFSFSCSATSTSRVKDEHPRTPCITDTPASVVVKYVEAVHTSKIYDKFVFDPICGLQTLADLTDVWRSHGYCSACISARREEWQSNKREIWRQLDDWLGLHSISL